MSPFSFLETKHFWAKTGNDRIWESRTVKRFGVTLDNKLNFDQHLNNGCLKASRKLSTLSRITQYLDFNQMRNLFKAFLESKYKYCPSTWMFYSRNTNKRNKPFTRKDPCISISWLWINLRGTFRKGWTIHYSSLQYSDIMHWIYNVCQNLSQTLFRELLTQDDSICYLPSISNFVIPGVVTVFKGLA